MKKSPASGCSSWAARDSNVTMQRRARRGRRRVSSLASIALREGRKVVPDHPLRDSSDCDDPALRSSCPRKGHAIEAFGGYGAHNVLTWQSFVGHARRRQRPSSLQQRHLRRDRLAGRRTRRAWRRRPRRERRGHPGASTSGRSMKSCIGNHIPGATGPCYRLRQRLQHALDASVPEQHGATAASSSASASRASVTQHIQDLTLWQIRHTWPSGAIQNRTRPRSPTCALPTLRPPSLGATSPATPRPTSSISRCAAARLLLPPCPPQRTAARLAPRQVSVVFARLTPHPHTAPRLALAPPPHRTLPGGSYNTFP